MTPAAVGFQIKQLEEELGGPLFLRKHRAVELTSRGLRLSRKLKPAFKTINAAWNAVREPVEHKTLKVSGPTRALHDWILPAVSGPSNKPEFLISWDMSKELRDVSMGEADLAIRWAKEPTSDLHWEPLLRSWFTPLVRPEVARYVQRPVDLHQCGLIAVEYRVDADSQESMWSAWHRLNDLDPPTEYAVTCADTASAVEAAIATGHAAIAGSFLAREELSKGDLVAPFDLAVAPYSRFWLVCRQGLETTTEYLWFLEAVLNSAKEINATADAMRICHPDGSPAEL